MVPKGTLDFKKAIGAVFHSLSQAFVSEGLVCPLTAPSSHLPDHSPSKADQSKCAERGLAEMTRMRHPDERSWTRGTRL
jgi:hypothetical protein